MAYVRKRGKQLLFVQGIRDAETGKVDQRILFTVYSKAEALAILGRGKENNEWQFQQLMEKQYPEIRFNWKRIQGAIQANMDVLPDLYKYKETRIRSQFRNDFCAFARQLMLMDPQDFMSASGLIEDHQVELEYLTELIQWRLQLRKQEPSQWNTDNPFYWRFTLQGTTVPPDIEETVEEFYLRGEYERAAVLFKFLTDCFPGYAEGYNYLGLIALDRNMPEEAIGHFREAISLGRKLFPKKIQKNRFWNDLSTRPYMRAMRNLTLALNRAGQYEESLQLSECLERECGDDISPVSYRALVYLNTNRWQEAADSALKLQRIDPSESFIAAFALYELGQNNKAMSCFLHGMLNFPLAAKMMVGLCTTSSRGHAEARDHNVGVDVLRNLNGYLKSRGQKSRRYFGHFMGQPHVKALLDEIEDVVKRRKAQHRVAGEREAFDRMVEMQSVEFSHREAKKAVTPG